MKDTSIPPSGIQYLDINEFQLLHVPRDFSKTNLNSKPSSTNFSKESPMYPDTSRNPKEPKAFKQYKNFWNKNKC